MRKIVCVKKWRRALYTELRSTWYVVIYCVKPIAVCVRSTIVLSTAMYVLVYMPHVHSCLCALLAHLP